MKHLTPIFIFLTAVACVMSSCLDSGGTTITGDTYKIARVTGLTLKNDSIEGLDEVTFKIFSSYIVAEEDYGIVLAEDSQEVGLIINLDSMAYGTVLDSVKPTFTYYSTPSSATMTLRHYFDRSIQDTVVAMTGTDTLNMSADTIYLDIVSYDGTATKRYHIIPRIHQVDPDLYDWKKVADNIFPDEFDAEQAMLVAGNSLYIFANDGLNTVMRTATLDSDIKFPTSITFAAEKQITSLPMKCQVRQIVVIESENDVKFYYADSNTGNVYSSADGETWSGETVSGYTFMATMFAFPDSTGAQCPWFYAKNSAGTDCLVYRAEDGTYNEFKTFPANSLPISGFSTVHFASASNRERLMVLGGFAEDGTMLRKRYNIEYSSVLKKPRLTDFSVETLTFPLLINSSVVCYNNRLMLFGAQDDSYEYIGRDIYQSTDEGIRWSLTDTARCVLPEEYTARKMVCSGVHNRNIYLFGGSDNSHNYSDLYIGRLQSVDWE